MVGEMFTFKINTLDKVAVNQEFINNSEKLTKISWDHVEFHLIFELNDKCYVYEEVWNDPELSKVEILSFLRNNVVNLVLSYDIEGKEAWIRTLFFRILYSISSFNALKHFKIKLTDMRCLYGQTDLHLTNIPNLESLDLSECNLIKTSQESMINPFLYSLIYFFDKIPLGNAKLVKICLPSFLKKIIIIQEELSTKLFTAISKALQNSVNFLEIHPFSFFLKKYPQLIFKNIKPGLLEFLYNNYQNNLEVIHDVSSINMSVKKNLRNILIETSQEKEEENQEISLKFQKFTPNEMTPDNLYWLEKFNREILLKTEGTLTYLCLLKKIDKEKKYLYKTLEEIISGLQAFDIKEQSPEINTLTTFIIIQNKTEDNELFARDMIITLLKLNKEFHLCHDPDLAKLFYMLVINYINPTVGCNTLMDESVKNIINNGNKYDGNHMLTMYLLEELRHTNQTNQINNLSNLEEQNRFDINLQMMEEYQKHMFLFEKYKNFNYEKELSRFKILLEEQEEWQNIVMQKCVYLKVEGLTL